MIIENDHDNALSLPPAGTPEQVRVAVASAMRILAFPPEGRALAFAELILAYRHSLDVDFPHASRAVRNKSMENYGNAVLAKLGEIWETNDGTVGHA